MEPVSVEEGTVQVERGNIYHIDYLNVTVVPVTQKLSFTTSGTLSTISVKTGDTVKAGQKMAALDTSDLEEEIAETKAENEHADRSEAISLAKAYDDSQAASAGSSKAQADLSEIVDSQAENQQNLSSASSELQTAQQNLKDNQEALEKAKQDLSDTQALLETLQQEEGSAASVEECEQQIETLQNQIETLEETQETLSEEVEELEGEVEELTEEAGELEEQVKEADAAAKQAAIEAQKASLIYQQTQEDQSLSQTQRRQQLTTLSSSLEGTTLTAPFDGRVVAVNVYEGEKVSSYETVIILADESQKRLKGEPYSNASLTSGIRCEADINGRTCPVSYQAYDAAEYLRKTMKGETLYTYFTIEDASDTDISYGDTGTVRLYLGESEDTLLVPSACLMSDSMGNYVYVDRDGQREKTYVTVGITTDTQVEILDGLQEGEQVYDIQ